GVLRDGRGRHGGGRRPRRVAALTWGTTVPRDVDRGDGSPPPGPGDRSAGRIQAREGQDAATVDGADRGSSARGRAIRLRRGPRIGAPGAVPYRLSMEGRRLEAGGFAGAPISSRMKSQGERGDR